MHLTHHRDPVFPNHSCKELKLIPVSKREEQVACIKFHYFLAACYDVMWVAAAC